MVDWVRPVAETEAKGGELLSLKALAENRASFARSALFDRVAGILFESEGELKPEVRELIDQILTGLIHQVEIDVRKKVSERLSNLETAPHALTRLLAHDMIDIAQPILHHSPVLTIEDLIAIIKAKTADHRIAIAQRPVVPPEVSAALAAAGESKVIHTLLSNTGAIVSRDVFVDLVALSKAVDTIRQPLIQRHDMPKDLAHQMFWFVSAVLRHAILERFTIDPADLDAAFAHVLSEKDIEKPKAGQPTAFEWRVGEISALIAKLRGGDVTAFLASMSQLLNVDREVVKRILADKGGEALAVACKAMGADRSQFNIIFSQVEAKRPSMARGHNYQSDISKVYDLLPKEKARAAVTLWNAQVNSSAA